MPLKKIIFFLFSVCLFTSTMAQNMATDSITWNVVQLRDLTSNATVNYQCQFKTHATQPIYWIQDDWVTPLTIQSVSGSWINVQVNGKITFQITTDGESGSLVFERTASGVTISIDLSQAGTSRLRHQYLVDQIN